ncbi:RES domain-containing protein [Telmatocola sphagniphila]|uniref:RES domain-containing protein n=1 Tax=Telmatocola sphagniphila TaxID=1123043 RepID=A0A8E6B6I2_9BACT|nr:RES domain-containing protein [Telmatocola sphagniphila]QVL32369.1 RES domain-containing protein [Telmatocola sphagniphila]
MSLNSEFFRVVGPRYTTPKEILSGMGSYLGGGRWNPLQVMKVLYLSADPITAMHEAKENYRYYKLRLAQEMPKVTVAIKVKVESILNLANLDLTDIL